MMNHEPPATANVIIAVAMNTPEGYPLPLSCSRFIPKIEVARFRGTETKASIVNKMDVVSLR